MHRVFCSGKLDIIYLTEFSVVDNLKTILTKFLPALSRIKNTCLLWKHRNLSNSQTSNISTINSNNKKVNTVIQFYKRNKTENKYPLIHIYTHAYRYIHKYAHIPHIHRHANAYTRMPTHTQILRCTHTFTHKHHTHTDKHMHIPIHTYTYTRTHMYIHLFARMHARMYREILSP